MREATVWVEVDRPCRVTVLGHEAPTFAVEDHHFALVRIDGLAPGSTHPYEVALDGHTVWPRADDPFPAPTVRTLTEDHHAHRIVFGSCRVAVPDHPPFTMPPHRHGRGVGGDAMRALALRAISDPAEIPDLLMLLGDQVYVEEGAPFARAAIRWRRDTTRPPGDGPADFEEYTLLYREAWADPEVRWLLSTVPTAMIFDDHEVHDDWNISESWRREIWREPWWEPRVTGAFMSYWCYQHLGNRAPEALAEDDLARRALAGGDLSDDLRAAAGVWCRGTDGARWSYRREIGGSRLVVIDSRAGRVLEGGRRDMLDDDEWAWVEEQLRGDVDHLVVASSLPVLLLPTLHHLEAWNERVCAGAWGPRMAALGERLRRGADLEHWAAFGTSFRRLTGVLGDVAAGRRGAPPGSVVLLSGDVHHTYVARMTPRRAAAGARCPVAQIVSSPIRNPLPPLRRLALRVAARPAVAAVARLLARSAGCRTPAVRWHPEDQPIFDNQLASLHLDGRAAEVRIEAAEPHPHEGELREVLRDVLAAPAPGRGQTG